MKKISVVVPVYNAEKHILETLRSIAAQTFEDFDVAVVDDCSTDNSASIIQRFCKQDDRFKYYRMDRNSGGPAGPRNLGIAVTSSDYVAFCDADDLWAPFKLEVQMDVARRAGPAIITTAVRGFTDGDIVDPLPPSQGPVSVKEIPHGALLLRNWVALSSVLASRTWLSAAGEFNTARSHVAVEDFDMWLRITSLGGKVVRIGTPLVHYRKSPTQISADKGMMLRKALDVIGKDYARRGAARSYIILRPAHAIMYLAASTWVRFVQREK